MPCLSGDQPGDRADQHLAEAVAGLKHFDVPRATEELGHERLDCLRGTGVLDGRFNLDVVRVWRQGVVRRELHGQVDVVELGRYRKAEV